MKEKRDETALGDALDAGRAALADPTSELDSLKDVATMLLFALWETDDDPARQPWPGGPEEERLLRLSFRAPTQQGS